MSMECVAFGIAFPLRSPKANNSLLNCHSWLVSRIEERDVTYFWAVRLIFDQLGEGPEVACCPKQCSASIRFGWSSYQGRMGDVLASGGFEGRGRLR